MLMKVKQNGNVAARNMKTKSWKTLKHQEELRRKDSDDADESFTLQPNVISKQKS